MSWNTDHLCITASSSLSSRTIITLQWSERCSTLCPLLKAINMIMAPHWVSYSKGFHAPAITALEGMVIEQDNIMVSKHVFVLIIHCYSSVYCHQLDQISLLFHWLHCAANMWGHTPHHLKNTIMLWSLLPQNECSLISLSDFAAEILERYKSVSLVPRLFPKTEEESLVSICMWHRGMTPLHY